MEFKSDRLIAEFFYMGVSPYIKDVIGKKLTQNQNFLVKIKLHFFNQWIIYWAIHLETKFILNLHV